MLAHLLNNQTNSAVIDQSSLQNFGILSKQIAHAHAYSWFKVYNFFQAPDKMSGMTKILWDKIFDVTNILSDKKPFMLAS